MHRKQTLTLEYNPANTIMLIFVGLLKGIGFQTKERKENVKCQGILTPAWGWGRHCPKLASPSFSHLDSAVPARTGTA